VESAKVVRDGRWAEVRIPRLDLVERELAVAVRIVETVELRDRGLCVPEESSVLAERPLRARRRPPVLGARYAADVEAQSADRCRHVVDVEQRLDLFRSERRIERSRDRVPVRIRSACSDDVVDTRCDYVEIAHEPRDRTHP